LASRGVYGYDRHVLPDYQIFFRIADTGICLPRLLLLRSPIQLRIQKLDFVPHQTPAFTFSRIKISTRNIEKMACLSLCDWQNTATTQQSRIQKHHQNTVQNVSAKNFSTLTTYESL
jgi:hypothetical protein